MPPSYQSEIVATASAALLGVIGAIAITKPDLAGGAGLNEGVMRWLLYCIAGGGPKPSKPRPRADLSAIRIDQFVNLARTHLKRRLISFGGERPQKHP